MSPTRVTFLSDFGTADGYAAAMAGVVAAAAPAAAVEHAAHDIAPGDIFGAALALVRYALLYPPGTVHLIVVDPGVGTGRRAIAATIEGRHFVAPDNGVLTLVLRDAADARVVAVERAGRGRDAAPTFHGRDIFAPAAAYLARGEPLDGLGPAIRDPVTLEIPAPSRGGQATPAGQGGRGEQRRVEPSAQGEVLHVDRFGNLITNIPAAWVSAGGGGHGDGDAGPGGRDAGRGERERRVRVRVGGVDVGPVRRTYGDVDRGELVALIGSLDLLEVSVRDGSAARRLDANRGSAVELTGAGAPSDDPVS